VGLCRCLITPKGGLIEYAANEGPAAHGAKAVRMHSKDNAILKLDLKALDSNNFRPQHWRRLKQAANIAKHRPSLVHRTGEHQAHASLAARKPVLDEQRQINRNGCSDARLARTATADTPQFAHAPRGNGAIAGNSSEGLTFTGIKRTAKRGFQDREPR